MSFCTKCGQPRGERALFCTTCGARFPATARPEPPPAVSEEPAAAPPTVAEPLLSFTSPPPVEEEPFSSPGYATVVEPPAAPPPPPPPPMQQPGPPLVYPQAPQGSGMPDDAFGGLFRDEAGAPTAQFGAAPAPPPPTQPGFGYPGPGQPPDQIGTEPPERNRGRVFLIVAVVIIVLAGGGVGAWAALGGKKHPTAQPTHSAQPTTSAPTPPPTTTSAAPTPTPTPTPTSSLVAVGPGVAPQTDEQAVLNFLTSYFTAINHHDYQQYSSLLDAQEQQNLTEGQFNSGYRSTKDSAATLTSLAPAGSGTVAASVSFTSHQSASNSPTNTTCTNWNITLYLRPQGGSYVIGAAPSSYHASYSAC